MGDFYIMNDKYIPKCPECFEIIKFQLNFEKCEISIECRNGHNKEGITKEEFYKEYMTKTQLYKNKCSNCFQTLNDEMPNYICQICKKIYCSKCFMQHFQKTSHNQKNNFFHQYLLCKEHNQKYINYCEKCKKNICNKCKELSHMGHDIKLFSDIIPSLDKLNSAKKTIGNFIHSPKLGLFIRSFPDNIKKENSNYTKDYLELIKYRSKKLEDFLRFIKKIYEHLVIGFNDNYYDYYNFANLNYLINYISNENTILDKEKIEKILLSEKKEYESNLIFDNGNYLNQINFIPFSGISDIKVKKVEYNCINYFKDLAYLKDNMFYIIEDYKLKFFEYKVHSFKLIPELCYNLPKEDIKIYKSKLFNKLIIIIRNRIQFLIYDLSIKTINLLKEEIKTKNQYNSVIDNKNGDILVSNFSEIIIWRKKGKIYVINNIISKNSNFNLIDINESLFTFKKDNKFNFYNRNNYELCKVIDFDCDVTFVGILNEKSIAFEDYHRKVFIVDLKYLEIVQIFQFEEIHDFFSYFIIKENIIYEFNLTYLYSDLLTIVKNKYDSKNNIIVERKSINLNKTTHGPIITSNNYCFLIYYNTIIVINLDF